MKLTNIVKEESKKFVKEVIGPVVMAAPIILGLYFFAEYTQPTPKEIDEINRTIFYQMDTNKDSNISLTEWTQYQNRPRMFVR